MLAGLRQEGRRFESKNINSTDQVAARAILRTVPKNQNLLLNIVNPQKHLLLFFYFESRSMEYIYWPC